MDEHFIFDHSISHELTALSQFILRHFYVIFEGALGKWHIFLFFFCLQLSRKAQKKNRNRKTNNNRIFNHHDRTKHTTKLEMFLQIFATTFELWNAMACGMQWLVLALVYTIDPLFWRRFASKNQIRVQTMHKNVSYTLSNGVKFYQVEIEKALETTDEIFYSLFRLYFGCLAFYSTAYTQHPAKPYYRLPFTRIECVRRWFFFLSFSLFRSVSRVHYLSLTQKM